MLITISCEPSLIYTSASSYWHYCDAAIGFYSQLWALAVFKSPSQTKVAIVKTCDYWKYCFVLRPWPWPFSEGDEETYWTVTMCHLKVIGSIHKGSSLNQQLLEHLLKTITSKEDCDRLHIMRRNCFFSASRIRVGLIRRTGRPFFVCAVQGRLVAAGYRSRHPDRYHWLTPDHRC